MHNSLEKCTQVELRKTEKKKQNFLYYAIISKICLNSYVLLYKNISEVS